MKYINPTGIHPIVAKWLMEDDYDNHGAKGVSATGLLQPIRAAVLASRLRKGEVTLLGEKLSPPPIDISTLMRSKVGQVIHGSLEQSLLALHKSPEGLGQLYPELASKLGSLKINPEISEDPTKEVYVERRGNIQLDGVTISGKFDFIFCGELGDFKTTSVFGSALDRPSKFKYYILQASIYRMIFPDLVTEDTAGFLELYTDWNQKRASLNPDTYPQSPVRRVDVPLMPIAEIRQWVSDRLEEYRTVSQLSEEAIPHCTDEELWVGPSEFKYFTKATSTRATKNFKEDRDAAYALLAEKGTGVVEEVKGKAIRCLFCPAFVACSQKNLLIAEGRLELE